MTQLLLALGVFLLLLPGWCDSRAQQVGASQRARGYRTALSTGLVATLSGSLLWAAPIVLHLADRWAAGRGGRPAAWTCVIRSSN